jgi:hypothetical protein
MIQPRSFDVTLGEFSEEYTAWAIQGKSGKYLAFPDRRYPSRRPIRFFTNDYDASRVLEAILDAHPALQSQMLAVVEVRLLAALRRCAADKVHPRADSYVVNTPNEVYELLDQIKRKAAPPDEIGPAGKSISAPR